ncbi:hypothetical protein IJH01_00565 [Candidatus Saccharibacteria bacterium]|nr:hypothetical protein [Candidatus Saccharibacteria bacterium]
MVDIEIKITIDSVKELDSATTTFIKSLAKECKTIKIKSSANQSATGATAQKRKTPLRSLKSFGLSTLSINCLKNHHINYVEDIVSFTPNNLLEIRHLGPQRLKELLIAIQKWQEINPNPEVKKWLKRYEYKINLL